MAWMYLFIAGLFEIVWAIALKYSTGFTKPLPSVITVVAILLSIIGLAQALKSLPVGTSYAIWTGIGAVGTTLLGILLFNESRDVIRIVFIIFIITGIVGLQITSSS
jgi:quaternary ammonium compound-resistance protein SugE